VCATQVLPMRVGRFAFRYQGNGATPCQYIDRSLGADFRGKGSSPCQHVDTTRKAIDSATTLPLRAFI